jgi:hypothetical protein
MDRNTALFDYIKSGNVKGVIRCLETIRDPNRIEDDGLPLLNLAAKNGKFEIVAILIRCRVSRWVYDEASARFFVLMLEIIMKGSFKRKLARSALCLIASDLILYRPVLPIIQKIKPCAIFR